MAPCPCQEATARMSPAHLPTVRTLVAARAGWDPTIEPGLSRCGYGLVARMPGSSELRACAAGVIETDPRDPLPTRLLQAQRALDVLFEELSPSAAAVERVFFQVNARTAVSVRQVSGLALAAAAAHGCEVAEYSANEVKQALVGYGSATKRQVQQMVASVLGLADAPRP